jgi:tetratricopeptide (TPR) repeat protein
VRSGLGRPGRSGRRYAFTFQDLVVLRTARELIAQHVPAARVARSLAALAGQLPSGRPLSGLRIWAAASRVLVQEGEHRWNPETGQTVLDLDGERATSFEVEELEQRTAKLIELPRAASGAGSSESAAMAEFERALSLEDADPIAACTCYGKAIELDPDLIDAYVNLGRIAHESGNGVEAIRLYELAISRMPDDPVLYYNLALAVEDTLGASRAVRHYEKALDLAPDFADAHYNFATLCEKLELPQAAIKHFSAYKRLTETT